MKDSLIEFAAGLALLTLMLTPFICWLFGIGCTTLM